MAHSPRFELGGVPTVAVVTPRIGRLQVWQRIALVAAGLWPVYFVLIRVTGQQHGLVDSAQVFCPAGGVAAALFYLTFRHDGLATFALAPVLVSSELAARQPLEQPWSWALLVAGAHLVEIVVVAITLNWFGRRVRFDDLPLGMVGATMCSAAAGATAGALVVLAAPAVGWSDPGATLASTWLGVESIGLVAALPVGLVLCSRAWEAVRPFGAELAAAVLGLAAVCALLFANVGLTYPYPGLFVTLWIALRFGVGSTAVAIAVYSALIGAATTWQRGPFAEPGALLWSRGFVASYSVCCLVVAIVGTQRRDALQDALEAHAEISRMIDVDGLTGLATRPKLEGALEEALDAAGIERHLVAVVALDLDAFADVNAMHGRHSGDNLLTEVGARIRAQLPGADCIARIGGDEFAVVLRAVPGVRFAEETANQLRHLISVPVMSDEVPVSVTASAGLVLAAGGTADQVLRDVEGALHEAKAQGRNRVSVRTPEYRLRADAERALILRAPGAIANSEFVLAYQPITSFDGFGRGAEALVRWVHPNRGELPPADFLPVLQRAGLMPMLGEHVLDQALRQLNVWRASDPVNAPDWVSVNTSVSEVVGDSLVHRVRSALAAAGVTGRSLVLEITEEAIMALSGEVRGMLSDLRALGVSVAVDDFGTGFSGLAYLTRLPIDIVKFDQQFLRASTEPRARRLLTSACNLAKDLGLLIVIEGVESEDQYALARSAGADAVQGWFVGKPVPPARLPATLTEALLRIGDHPKAHRSDQTKPSAQQAEASSIITH